MLVSNHKKKMDAGSILNRALLFWHAAYDFSLDSCSLVTSVIVFSRYCLLSPFAEKTWLRVVLIRWMTLGNTVCASCVQELDGS